MDTREKLILSAVAVLIWAALVYPIFTTDPAKNTSDSGEQTQHASSDWLGWR